MTRHFLMTSVATLALASAPAFAQTLQEDTAVGEPVLGQDDATAVTTGGGQVVVEQGEPTVDVDVPDPIVSVDQEAPEVLVEQAEPEIIVTVPEPTVNVQQQAPIVTVEQAQPEVTVRIPEPVVTVRMPEPQVAVTEGEPSVSVQQPEPVVRFVRPEPRITIEEGEPRVNIADAEPRVNVDGAGQADVRVDQADANVSVQSEGQGSVRVSQADPEVNIENPDSADVNVRQAEPRVNVTNEQTGQQPAGVAVAEVDVVAYQDYADATVADLLGVEVRGARGNMVGEVDSIVRTSEGIMAIVGVGGFLGLGEHNVALPLTELEYSGDEMVVNTTTEAELERMPQYNRNEGVTMTPDMIIIENL